LLENDKDFEGFVRKFMQSMGYYDREGYYIDPVDGKR
jgi:hypothetical protein